MADLNGERTVLITGGTGAIGGAMVTRFLADGYQVAFTYRNETAKEALLAAHPDAPLLAVQADVAEPDDCRRVIDDVLGRTGRLDVLVNNAGITRDGLVMRMSDEDFQKVLQTNLAAAFYLIRAALRPMLKARSGAIINMASVVGLGGNAGQANYAASKAGLIALTKSVAMEVAARGIRVNAVAPGFIESPMTAVLGEGVREQYLNNIPLRRFGQPQDVANLVAFLASDEASYMTAQCVSVDGGMNR